MGKEHETAKAVEPAKTPLKSTASAAKRGGKQRPHALEATNMVKLLMRRIAEHSHDPDGATGKLQTAKIALAGSEIAGLLREVQRVAQLEKIDWKAVQLELAQGLAAVTTLRAMMKGQALHTVRAELAEALGAVENVVPAKAWQGAQASKDVKPAAPLDADASFELARNAVIAACREVTVFKSMTPTGNDKAEGLALMAPIAQHFQTAIDAAVRVPKHQRMALVPDMELASKGMDHADGFLSAPPKAKWHRVYAAAFDAENRARETIGAKPLRVRTYSGTVDPEQAIETVKDMARDGKAVEGWASKAFDTPQQAVQGIAASLDRIFELKHDAVGRFATDIKEPPRPPSTPLWQKLLEVAVKVALSTAAGALASYAEGAIKLRIDRFAGSRAGIPMPVFNLLPKEEQAQWLADKTSSVGRKVAADAAKDGFKEILKSSGHLAFTLLMPKPMAKVNSREPVSAFVQVQQEILREAKHQARMMMIHLGPALTQADLEVLNALHLALFHDIAASAADTQYNATMVEWQNHKARLDAGEAKANDPKAIEGGRKKWKSSPKQSGKDDALDANVDGETQGAFEVKVYVQTEQDRGRWFMPTLKLPGAEPATVRHLRSLNKPIAEVPMHKRFDLRFLAAYGEEKVEVAVGPNQGLLLSSLHKQEKGVVKLYTSGERLTGGNLWVARTGTEYDQKVRDQDAIYTLAKLIEGIAMAITTRDLQGKAI